MCGRFALKTPSPKLSKIFDASVLESFNPHYNIAPTARIPVIQWDPDKKTRVIKRDYWGLIPYWAKNPSISYHTSNARADTVAEKPSFKNAFKQRRCLVIADGFYEWERSTKPSQPYYFSMKDEQPFAMAGLFESWKVRWENDPRDLAKAEKEGKKPPKIPPWPVNLGGKEYNEGDVLESCTIITTDPNPLMAKIHDRMPVILDPKDYDTWLAGSPMEPAPPNHSSRLEASKKAGTHSTDLVVLKALLKPFSAAKMQSWPVDRLVNKVGVDDTENCVMKVI